MQLQVQVQLQVQLQQIGTRAHVTARHDVGWKGRPRGLIGSFYLGSLQSTLEGRPPITCSASSAQYNSVSSKTCLGIYRHPHPHPALPNPLSLRQKQKSIATPNPNYPSPPQVPNLNSIFGPNRSSHILRMTQNDWLEMKRRAAEKEKKVGRKGATPCTAPRLAIIATPT